jgi:hypothetical protein
MIVGRYKPSLTMQLASELQPNIIIGDNFEGVVELQNWNSLLPTGKLANIRVEGNSVDYVKISTQAQVNSIQYLQDNSEGISDLCLNGIYERLSDLRTNMDYDIPDFENVTQLQENLTLNCIHVLTVEKNEYSYVGFEFDCSWDKEHGIGIMTHKNRIVEVGEADTSFLNWIAEEDL